MNRALTTAGLCLAALPVAASANVNISKTLNVPTFEGLSLTAEPSPEVNWHAEREDLAVLGAAK